MVYTSLLCFTLLAALKLDGEINISWWTVFGPIWCWNGLVIAGALVGSGLGTNRIIFFAFYLGKTTCFEGISLMLGLVSQKRSILHKKGCTNKQMYVVTRPGPLSCLVEKTSESSQRRRIHSVQSHANKPGNTFAYPHGKSMPTF